MIEIHLSIKQKYEYPKIKNNTLQDKKTVDILRIYIGSFLLYNNRYYRNNIYYDIIKT